MSNLPRAIEEAQDRLTSKEPLVAATHRHIDEGRARFLDPEMLPHRIKRLLNNPLVEGLLAANGVTGELRGKAGLIDLSETAHGELERVIHGPDFMPSWFLSRGSELRRTVARVRARTASGKEKKGTGFLVGPRLLLTNAHVLDWSDIGEESISQIVPHSVAEFDYEEQYDGSMQAVSTFRLDSATLLLFSPWDVLDYALVALAPRANEGNSRIEDFGYNLLAGDVGKISKGEPVFIVQHPNGLPKQVVLQNNRLIDRDDAVPYLTYEADTDIGSSGAPVFNRQWEVVALHHAPQIARNAAGQMLDVLGNLWSPTTGTRIRFLNLNEGVRVSRLMNDWDRKSVGVEARSADALTVPECCSAVGAELLSTALAAQIGASPTTLVVPIPIERTPTPLTGNQGSPKRRFPRPD